MKFWGEGCVIAMLVIFFSIAFIPAIVAFDVPDKTIYVDDDNTEGPWDGSRGYPYRHIQDAIDVAEAEDTIFVHSGMYYEHIVVDKTLILQGEEKTSTIIDSGNHAHIVKVVVDGVTISGFTIQNSSYQYNGINIYSSYNIIENNIIQNNGYNAILLMGHGSDSTRRKAPSYNVIHGNIIRNNRGKGISIWGGVLFFPDHIYLHISLKAQHNIIKNNYIEDNHHGIYLAKDTKETLIELNEFRGNDISVAPMYSRFNVITKNNFLGNDPFFQSGIHEWNENYWGQPLDAPKRIVGRIGYFGILPWLNFDEHPAQEPYNIGGR